MAKDPLFSNKLFGAILFAGVLATGTGFVAKLLHKTDSPEKNAYPIEVTDAAGGEVASTEPMDTIFWSDVEILMTTAQNSGQDTLMRVTGKGEKIFKKCASCHNIASGAPHKTGPNIRNVVGRPIASAEGYNYSRGLLEMSGGTWTLKELNAFLTKPKVYAPGTKMSYNGLKKVPDRAALLLYLNTQSDQ
ncbi:MAG: cytochrome c family protein [Alphaproteobacteria bacterium]|nr:cytochrome c family protein [Alphaproteobacteria bacterium]